MNLRCARVHTCVCAHVCVCVCVHMCVHMCAHMRVRERERSQRVVMRGFRHVERRFENAITHT